MRTLEERLEAIRSSAKDRIPEEHRKRMLRATVELQDSGAAARALSEGASAPTFELLDSGGTSVGLSDWLEKGPVILTFFRGHW